MTYFEEHVFPQVLANEVLCRSFIDEVVRRGAKIEPDPRAMTHEECAELAIKIYKELALFEIRESNRGLQ